MGLKQSIVNYIFGLKAKHYRYLKTGMKYAWRMKCRKYYLKPGDKLTKEQRQAARDYWHQFTRDFDLAYHNYYTNRTGIFDVRYIPDDLYASVIDPYFNNWDFHIGVCDKNYFDIWFPDCNTPNSFVRKINGIYYNADYKLISEQTAAELLFNAEKVVEKPSSESEGGRNVSFYHIHSLEEAKTILEKCDSKNMVYQCVIDQHPALKKIHPESVNTLRIMTLLFQGKVYCIQSILRMGIGGSKVDNAMSGGIYCGISAEGKLKKVAFDLYGNRYDQHPSGFVFDGYEIPAYHKAVEMVTREAEKMAHFRLISWDVAIDSNEEPVLIEANLRMGDIDIVQPVNGPLFGELTDAVLHEVFSEK